LQVTHATLHGHVFRLCPWSLELSSGLQRSGPGSVGPVGESSENLSACRRAYSAVCQASSFVVRAGWEVSTHWAWQGYCTLRGSLGAANPYSASKVTLDEWKEAQGSGMDVRAVCVCASAFACVGVRMHVCMVCVCMCWSLGALPPLAGNALQEVCMCACCGKAAGQVDRRRREKCCSGRRVIGRGSTRL
jgi:hypothetical protein